MKIHLITEADKEKSNANQFKQGQYEDLTKNSKWKLMQNISDNYIK